MSHSVPHGGGRQNFCQKTQDLCGIASEYNVMMGGSVALQSARGVLAIGRMKLIWIFIAALLESTTPALARDFCPDRPGIDTPPCTLGPGHLSVEASVGDWTRDSSSDAKTDTLLIGDLTLRYGIADHAEIRLGWTAFGHVHSQDRLSGAIDRLSGTGDVALGIKRNLIAPDGKGFSIALLPSISLPTGGQAIGAEDWSAGVRIPVNIPVNQAVSFIFTPEIDAAVDSDGDGRHLAYGTAGGIAVALLPNLNIAIESAVMQDDDPAGTHRTAIAGLAAGLILAENTQLDIGSEFGLNGSSPDTRLYVGIARRF